MVNFLFIKKITKMYSLKCNLHEVLGHIQIVIHLHRTEPKLLKSPEFSHIYWTESAACVYVFYFLFYFIFIPTVGE